MEDFEFEDIFESPFKRFRCNTWHAPRPKNCVEENLINSTITSQIKDFTTDEFEKLSTESERGQLISVVAETPPQNWDLNNETLMNVVCNDHPETLPTGRKRKRPERVVNQTDSRKRSLRSKTISANAKEYDSTRERIRRKLEASKRKHLPDRVNNYINRIDEQVIPVTREIPETYIPLNSTHSIPTASKDTMPLNIKTNVESSAAQLPNMVAAAWHNGTCFNAVTNLSSPSSNSTVVRQTTDNRQKINHSEALIYVPDRDKVFPISQMACHNCKCTLFEVDVIKPHENAYSYQRRMFQESAAQSYPSVNSANSGNLQFVFKTENDHTADSSLCRMNSLLDDVNEIVTKMHFQEEYSKNGLTEHRSNV